MTLRLVAFVIWAAVAASAMFWLLRLGASSPAAPAHTVAAGAAAPARGDLTRVFGAAPVRDASGANLVIETPLSARFKLLGVAAPRQGGDRNGLALIAVDGKPARSYAVGSAVDGDMLLQAVHARGAAPQVTLELPALPPAATGSLPPASGQGPALERSGMVIPPPGPITRPALPPPTESQQVEPVPVPQPPPGSLTR